MLIMFAIFILHGTLATLGALTLTTDTNPNLNLIFSTLFFSWKIRIHPAATNLDVYRLLLMIIIKIAEEFALCLTLMKAVFKFKCDDRN